MTTEQVVFSAIALVLGALVGENRRRFRRLSKRVGRLERWALSVRASSSEKPDNKKG